MTVETPSAPKCPACGSELSRDRASEGLCPACLVELALESPSLLAELEGPQEGETLVYAREAYSPGQVLGQRYRIRALLGRGGMGEVWRATDLKLRVDVALKALLPQLLEDTRALETLRQEVRVAREVVSPNVCRVFDLVELDGQELVSMEYIDGITLLEIMKLRAPFQLSEAREIAAQFLAGLQAIHDAGLVHRDVKPENLMMTRSGRVVLMDFGIAKGLAEAGAETISGTPAYMSPEQARGEALDARADVFSAGVVLAEMIAPGGLGSHKARQRIWEGVHREPPDIFESPWSRLLKTAVSKVTKQRPTSAAALARALEEVTLRVDEAEGIEPYPGLAAFTEADAEYFFGRELEVEALWRRLQRPHLLGLIGPSGAGKSSFLRAGLLPVIPTGWQAVVTAPGSRPVTALGQALSNELSGDPEAVRDLLRFEEMDVAVSLISRWRQRHDQALLIVDQFEELFTQNPPEGQRHFAELLGRLALEADVHVLLSMRDDFLGFCSQHESLAPIFSELTPLKPLTEGAVRRALVQPALKCGYKFEDDRLVDEMVGEVSDERGALPLLAFAASRLWDHRDREHGLLTREAYEHIGGVGGALAQHAEATLEKIGEERIPIVRELFRNLVTAQGTRAARDREELLSVFAEKSVTGTLSAQDESDLAGSAKEVPVTDFAATEVLNTLIDARLLTSYEVPAADEEDTPHHRIEIIHESLLSNWPRLVRWQTQDADSAQLRDQIRQAAQMWEERGRPEDLLWTGTSFGEYRLWLERYEGGLSTAEEDFGAAMDHLAERQKRRRRLIVATVIVLLLGVAATLATFWRRSEAATRLSEASNLFALARLQSEDEPTAFIAYAISSLERADNEALRYEVLEALWRGPTELRMPIAGLTSLDFSPDGEWLATASQKDPVTVWPSDGGSPITLEGSSPTGMVRFSPTSDIVAHASGNPLNWSEGVEENELRWWSFPEKRPIGSADIEDKTVALGFSPDGERLLTAGATLKGERLSTKLRSWPVAGGEPELLGGFEQPPPTDVWPLASDPPGSHIAWVDGHEAYVAPLDGAPVSRESARSVKHDNPVIKAVLDQQARQLATVDDGLTVRLWSLAQDSPELIRTLPGKGEFHRLRFDPSGSLLAGSKGFLWHLRSPPDAEFRPLIPTWVEEERMGFPVAIHPRGEWLAAGNTESISLWLLARPMPRVLRGHEGGSLHVRFSSDGRWLVSTGRDDGTVRLWPLDATLGERPRILYQTEVTRFGLIGPGVGGVAPSPQTSAEWARGLAVAPDGSYAVIGTNHGRVVVIPLNGDPVRQLASLSVSAWNADIGPHSGLIAVGFDDLTVRVWNLTSGEVRVLAPDCVLPEDECESARVDGMRFTTSGELVVSSDLHRRWDLEGNTPRLLEETEKPTTGEQVVRFSPDGRLALRTRDGSLWLDDLRTSSTRQLASHGSPLFAVFDPSGEIVVSGQYGSIRVGKVSRDEAHLLLGHEQLVMGLAVSPDGQRIASACLDGTIRVWPMPDLSQPPLHTLPRDELIAKLKALTNLRAVRDPESSTGWRIGLEHFPGWKEVPTW